MRRLLFLLVILVAGGAAAGAVRRLATERPTGTPAAWPAVPRKPVGAA